MEEKETGRIEAFSDGVFAVAITLLVLNLQIPKPPSSEGLLVWLGHQWPAYLAFVTSFAIVGVMWINHHRMFTLITRSDSMLMGLNLLLLMLIVFIPFPTALVAQYISLPPQPFATDQRVAALVYNGTAILLAICFNTLWRYATYKGRLQGKNADNLATQSITRQYRFGPLFYALAFALAWVYVPASLILNLLMAVYFALPLRKSRPLSEAK